MHELSIAESLLDLVRTHVPAGHVLKRVYVRAGAMRAIEPTSMEWAWQAATRDRPEQGSDIVLENLPWTLTCGACGRVFECREVPAACACGSSETTPSGSDELTLRALDVDVAEVRKDSEVGVPS